MLDEYDHAIEAFLACGGENWTAISINGVAEIRLDQYTKDEIEELAAELPARAQGTD